MERTVISVAQYLDTVNGALRRIDASAIAVQGEVSDYRVAQGKWVSFDLKDEEAKAVLKCFMTVWQLQVPLEDGMRAQVVGYPKVYERFGSFKMNVQEVALVGEGALRKAYEALKAKLAEEGLFDPARKRPLPRFPSRIGLITSRDAAAYGDFLRILNNRWGGVEVDFAHVHVQGRQAVDEILAAFSHFDRLPEAERPDAVVLIRGGGGLEDLHAFNDEAVARAAFRSKAPVVVGVGHERDESLCDFVADIRASTPSNAAERAVPDRGEVSNEIARMTHRLEDRLGDAMERRADRVDRAVRAVSFALDRQRTACARLEEDLLARADRLVASLAERLAAHERFLKGIDPERVLARGFSLVTAGGRVVTDAASLDIGSEITVRLAAGSVDAEVLRRDGKGKRKLL